MLTCALSKSENSTESSLKTRSTVLRSDFVKQNTLKNYPSLYLLCPWRILGTHFK